MSPNHGARPSRRASQTNRPGFWNGLSCALCLAGCAPVDDFVFESTATVALVVEAESVREDDGRPLTLTLRLQRPPPEPVSATFRLEGIETQDNCHFPDFTNNVPGSVRWEAGQAETAIELWVQDDEVAETDERFKVVLDEVMGASLGGSNEIEVTILDDDRDALIEASEYGVVPARAGDQSAELQRALDQARTAGRGVVVLAPGEYVIDGVNVHPGTTLTGRGARLLRSPEAGAEAVTITVSHGGEQDSRTTLIEGLTVDGQRELQGSFQNWEQSNAHLISAFGDAASPGRLRVSFEGVSVTSGTGDGIAIGTQSEAFLCNILAHNLWRDAIGLHGGGSLLRLRNLAASATEGTSGIWMDGDTPGFEDNRRVDIGLEDVNLNSGDLEVSLAQGSALVATRVSMDRPPFRLLAADSSVQIHESRLYVGLPGPRREDGELPPLNQFQVPHNVTVSDSVLIAAELPPEFGDQLPEQPRTFAIAEVDWTPEMVNVDEPGGHQLIFENCRFELDGASIDADDTVYAVRSPEAGGTVTIRSSTLGDGFAGWFAQECEECSLED